MADAKNKVPVAQDMQDYALIVLMKTIRRLELLDEKRNNESDIAKIRRYIGMFVQKAFNGNVEENTANSVFDKFPEVLEIAEEKDEAKANTLTKELMQKWRKSLLNQVTEYSKLAENDCETVILNAEKVYNEVFKPVIDNANHGSRKKPTVKIDRETFVKSVMSGDIDENTERLILSAKDNILKKLKERKNDTSRKPLFKEEINSLVQGLDISYQTERNSAAVKQANRKVRSYFSKADASSYRRDFPDDYTARPAKEGSKEDFLKLLGSLAMAGYNQVHLGIRPTEASFNGFKDIMKKNYPQDTDEIINKSLGIAKNSDKETQFKAFADKGASIYTQMLGGFIQLRMDVLKETPNTSIINSLKKYIEGMQNGAQDIHTLSMLMPEKDDGRGSVKQQLSQDQHVNVDHKIPVASAITTYIKLHPELGGALDPNKLSEKQLLELAEKAAPLVDNISNHRQVISKKVNDKLEANGNFVLDREKDNSILAVSYSYKNIQENIAKMTGLNSDMKNRYKEAFSKYSKASKLGANIITTELKLPENADIDKARKENTTNKDILDIRVITENALTIEK